MKLGTKVKCKGYLKKVKTHHVVASFEDAEKDMYYINMGGEIIDDEMSQPIKELVKLNFEGIIVAKKSVATERYFSFNYHPYNDEDFMQILQDKFIDCYQVFFRMGGSRLVPTDVCEVAINE